MPSWEQCACVCAALARQPSARGFSERAAPRTLGSSGSQVELRVWQGTAGSVEEAGIMVVEQSRVDTQKAVFISPCFAVPKLCGLVLPLLHTKEMEINFYMW